MDNLFIALASDIQVKQRVAVNTQYGWYVGTVKLVKTKYATILCDDGDTIEVDKNGGAKVFKVLPSDTKKMKQPLTATEVRNLIDTKVVKKVKEDVSNDSVQDKHTIKEARVAPPLPPVPKMRVFGRPVEPPISDTKHEEKPRADVDHSTTPLEQLKTVYEKSIRGSSGDSAIRRFMYDLWVVLNKEKFNNTLRPIKKFMVIPAAGRHGIRAFWHPAYRLIVFTNLVFKADWDKYYEIFLHEMCHQAVTDIDHNGKPMAQEEAGHGPEWKRWMIHVGLEPKRYDDSTFSEYMTEEDKELFDKNAENAMSQTALNIVRKKEHYESIKERRLVKATNCQVGALVTFSDGSTEEPYEGVVVLVHKGGKYSVDLYNTESINKRLLVSEDDEQRPLFFVKEPRIKYRGVARRMAEEARKIARKEGRAR